MAAAVSSPASGDMAMDLAAPFLPDPPSGLLLRAEAAVMDPQVPQEEPYDCSFQLFDDNPQNGNGLKRTGDEAKFADYPERPADDAKRRKHEEKKANSENWEHMYSRLVNYKLVHGDTLVPKRYTADPKLGTWVETQRVQYKKLNRAVDERSGVELVAPNNRLTPLRLEKLNAIGFAWTAKPVRQVGGDAAALPATAATRRGESLPSVPNIHGKTRENSASHAQRQSEDTWEELYQRLVQFQQREGHCVVPRKYEADPKLAAWVEQQRTMWNRQRKTVSAQTSTSGASDSSSDRLDELVGASDDPASEGYRAGDVAGDVVLNAPDSDAQFTTPSLDGETTPITRLSTEKLLALDRKMRLDALGFVWSLRSKRVEDHWDGMFQQLVQYRQIYGDCLVPSRWDANPKLGKWVETQRYEYTKLRRASTQTTDEGNNDHSKTNTARLTDDRIRRLESIGFEWKVKYKMKKYYDRQWDTMFERLLQFKTENGHCMVPKRYSLEPKLGVWVHTQRIQYRKLVDMKSNRSDGTSSDSAEERNELTEEISFRLTDDRRRRLEDIGFIWNAREGDKLHSDQSRTVRNSYDEQWDAMFNRLKAFKEKYGHCLVPKRYQDDARLGTWVDTQRVQYKKMKKRLLGQGDSAEFSVGQAQQNELNDECIASSKLNLVDSVGLPCDAGKTSVGRLTEERIRRLDDLGFVWSLRDDWNKHYEELRIFRREHGHCNVPARYAKNRRLGIWVSSQRQQYKLLKASSGSDQPPRSSPLTQERINLLNQLGFTWTVRSRDNENEAWAQRYQQLVRYKQMNGHCNVPVRSGELGVWTNTQRTQYRQYMKLKQTGEPTEGILSINEDRIRQLEAIGFVWVIRETKKDMDNLVYHEAARSRKENETIHPESASLPDAILGLSGTSVSSMHGQVRTGNEYHMDNLF